MKAKHVGPGFIHGGSFVVLSYRHVGKRYKLEAVVEDGVHCG
jgi:hypothetical protein